MDDEDSFRNDRERLGSKQKEDNVEDTKSVEWVA
jgi:hypothetical protein